MSGPIILQWAAARKIGSAWAPNKQTAQSNPVDPSVPGAQAAAVAANSASTAVVKAAAAAVSAASASTQAGNASTSATAAAASAASAAAAVTAAIDTDSTFAANSDAKVPSQKAVKTALAGVSASVDPRQYVLTGLIASTNTDYSSAAANTSLIQSYLNIAQAAGGGVVVIPTLPGAAANQYWINATIYVPGYCTLRGSSQAAVLKAGRISAGSAFNGARMVELGASAETVPPFARIENLSLDAYGQGLICVYSNKCQEGSGCEHVTGVNYGTGGAGFFFDAGGGLSPQNFVLQDVYAFCNAAATGTTAITIQGSGTIGALYKATVTSGGGLSVTGQAVSSTSARVALGALSSSGVAITNTGATTIYVKLGDSTVVATTSDVSIGAGSTYSVAIGSNTYIALVTASGTSTADIKGKAAQQNIGVYVNAAKMTVHDVHCEAHTHGVLANTGGSISGDGIEGYDGGSYSSINSVTNVVTLNPSAGPCTFRQLKALGSYALLNDQSVTPTYYLGGTGSTSGGAGTFVLPEYQNTPRQFNVRNVANLPTAPAVAKGARAIAGDLSGSTYTFGAAAAGGGSRVGPVFYTGSGWFEG